MSSRRKGSSLMKISSQINGNDQNRFLMLTEGSKDILDYAFNVGSRISYQQQTNGINGSYAEQTEFWKQYSGYESNVTAFPLTDSMRSIFQ